MDRRRVVAARDERFCLAGDVVFLCGFKRQPVKVAVIDRAAIHKADHRTFAERAYALVPCNVRKVCRRGAFEHNRIVGAHRVRRRTRAARADLFLHGEAAGQVIRLGLLQHLEQDADAHAVVERLGFYEAVAEFGIVRAKTGVVAERRVPLRFFARGGADVDAKRMHIGELFALVF